MAGIRGVQLFTQTVNQFADFFRRPVAGFLYDLFQCQWHGGFHKMFPFRVQSCFQSRFAVKPHNYSSRTLPELFRRPQWLGLKIQDLLAKGLTRPTIRSDREPGEPAARVRTQACRARDIGA